MVTVRVVARRETVASRVVARRETVAVRVVAQRETARDARGMDARGMGARAVIVIFIIASESVDEGNDTAHVDRWSASTARPTRDGRAR